MLNYGETMFKVSKRDILVETPLNGVICFTVAKLQGKK
jgi:hypothetical protein